MAPLNMLTKEKRKLLLSAINSKWGLNSYKHSVVNPSLIRYSNSMGFSGAERGQLLYDELKRIQLQETMHEYDYKMTNAFAKMKDTVKLKRFQLGLPTKGQRTRSNARTAKRINKSLYNKYVPK
ncbi:small ribosomal subunit protein uS13-like [Zophobas morio]|uniref:small ribosomal subunit protein uS13-like n=1 Tax=Zophobas morio TaxID=2755281 RepID=UPI003083D1FF